MRYAFTNGIILNGKEDMTPVKGKTILTDEETQSAYINLSINAYHMPGL